MEPCVQSITMNGPCVMCGGRAQKMHRPMFRRGSFCPRCCPVCKGQPASAAVTPPEAEAPTQDTSELKEGRWGPNPNDPWYRDERRYPPPWIPRRPHWFK
jgi:hypothetical protein